MPAQRPPPEKASPRLRVLIVEDMPTIAAMLQAEQRKASFRPDIALIDLGLPDMDGFDLIRRFAAAAVCGVIVVTANGEEAARIAGLDTGADDYVVKPVRIRELAARIRALHRRMRRPAESKPGSITIDRRRRCLTYAGAPPTLLTEAEFTALDILLDAEGTSVSREWLSRVALKRPLHHDDRSVDQLILMLRRKLVGHGASERTILSVRRQGYVISDTAPFRPAAQIPDNGKKT